MKHEIENVEIYNGEYIRYQCKCGHITGNQAEDTDTTAFQDMMIHIIYGTIAADCTCDCTPCEQACVRRNP